MRLYEPLAIMTPIQVGECKVLPEVVIKVLPSKSDALPSFQLKSHEEVFLSCTPSSTLIDNLLLFRLYDLMDASRRLD